MGFSAAVQQLLNYENIPDDVDQLIDSSDDRLCERAHVQIHRHERADIAR